MPDREKVIEWADKCTSPAHESEDCNGCPYHLNHEGFYSCIECLMRDTVAMLEEQEAVEPIRHYARSSMKPYGMEFWYTCGSCKAEILENDKFCHECGRAVKWE